MEEKKNITNRADVILLVDSFYDSVKKEELLGHVFNDVAKVNWETHLPKMYDFWEHILFQSGGYRGRPFPPHLEINNKEKITTAHFNKWLTLFHQTIDENFKGEKALELKQKSENLKDVWSYKMAYINHYNGLIGNNTEEPHK